MSDHERSGERVARVLSAQVDGVVTYYMHSDSVYHFKAAYPFMRNQISVSAKDMIESIENEGFQVEDVQSSTMMQHALFEARKADVETFVVGRMAVMSDGIMVLMNRDTAQIVEFNASAASHKQHLALTQPGDVVATLAIHGADGVTGFRNRTIERMDAKR